MVEVVEPGSRADKAGLKGGQLELTIGGQEFLMGGDIITRVNGVAITEPETMVDALRAIKVGSDISLTIFRDGEEHTIDYAVMERPLLQGDVAGPNASFTPARATASRPNGLKMAGGFQF